MSAQLINFEMVYEEYEKLGQMRAHADHHPRRLASRAFEALISRRLLRVDPRHAACVPVTRLYILPCFEADLQSSNVVGCEC